MKKWMIYGATGYAGKRIATEAANRGLTPQLAGRSQSELEEVGAMLDLETCCLSLDDVPKIQESLANIALLVNTAGPFMHTASTLREACLATGTSYIDISGEMDVLSESLKLNSAAKESGVLVVSGAGFDVVPTDCLAVSLANELTLPSKLSLALIEDYKFSKGTVASLLLQIPKGFFEVRKNRLSRITPGTMCKMVDLGSRSQYVMPFPWGDLVTAKASTRIKNISTYAGCNKLDAAISRLAFPILGFVYKSSTLLNWRLKLLNRQHQNPKEEELSTAIAFVWGRVENEAGEAIEGLLETPNGYSFTVNSIIEAVNRFFGGELGQLTGAMTPSQAFGAGFAESLPEVHRVY